MNIVLIAPYPDITSLGVRYLSAQLQAENFSTRILFIPGALKSMRFHSEFYYEYTARELEAIANHVRGADLVGLSFMSNYVERAIQITTHLKKTVPVTVIWGGVHPTACPQESLEYADLVCRGEGEYALIELCQALNDDRDLTGIANFWCRKGKTVIRNELRPLITDLDALAFPDYRFDVHAVLDRDTQTVRTLDEKTTVEYLAADAISTSRDPSKRKSRAAFYQLIATRGCPHECAFCYNSDYKKMYATSRYLRRRSVDNIIDEIAGVIRLSEAFRYIVFCDDSFFAASEKEIDHFAERYTREIGLPFHCLGSPQTITLKKLKRLVEAHLVSISMGIQSGSPATNEMYQRRFKEHEVLEATRVIHSFRDKLRPPAYDFIIDNPFETDADLLQSLDLVLKLPRPNHLCLGSLVFFPGTPLYLRAVNEGLLVDITRQVYRKEYHAKKGTYLNFLFYLASFMAPVGLIRFLMQPRLVNFFQKPYFNPLFTLVFRGTRALRIVRSWLKTNAMRSRT